MVRVVRARAYAVGRRDLVLAIVAVGLFCAAPAAATVVRYVGFDAQAVSADRIFVGSVIEVASRPIATAPRYFETIASFVVEEVVAGTVPARIELRFAGGRVGDLEQRIDGMPRPTAGERYVVFLEADHDPPLISPIVGFNQGLYRVVDAAEGGGASVVRDHLARPLGASSVRDVLATLPATDSRAATASSDGEPRLDAFLAAVRAARR